MDHAETLENACADAWPALVDVPLGQWRLRAADGFTVRANAALATGDPGTTVVAALRAVCEFAHEHGIEPVTLAIQDSATERAIADAGWLPNVAHEAGHEVSVLVGPCTGEQAPGLTVLDEPTRQWWELVAGDAEPSVAQRHVLGTGGKVGFGVATDGDTTVGAVRGAVVPGLLHVARLAVRPEQRRRGLGTALMDAMRHWAAGLGATRCVLQVDVRNVGAHAFYGGLGFTEHHRYRYWVPGTGAWKDSAA